MNTLQELLTTRFNKNLKFFQNYLPNVYQTIRQSETAPKLNVHPTSGAITRIHPDIQDEIDPITCCKENVRSFISKVEASDYRPNPASLYMSNLIAKEPLQSALFEYVKVQKERYTGYRLNLYIMGVGLGHHIELLIQQRRFLHISVIEDDVDNLIASMYATDWESIFRSLKENQRISLVVRPTNMTQKDFEHNVAIHTYKQYPMNVNATIFYTHHNNSVSYKKLKQSIIDFSNLNGTAFERLGPDIQRLLNLGQNFYNGHPVINFDASMLKHKDIAVIGAGPSLDIYIEALKAERKRFFIISAGSSLRSLMRNGIKPDIHFELEFQHLQTNSISFINEEYPLSDIDLICTAEVQPNIPTFFRNTYLYIPESSELSNLFNERSILRQSGLTCTNGAIGLACKLAKNNIYLFGLDFAHTDNKHHAEDNITNQKGLPENISFMNEYYESHHSKINTIGVSGDVLPTTTQLQSARIVLERQIRSVENIFFNCSTGAAIEGTKWLSVRRFNEQCASQSHSSNNLDAHIKIESDSVDADDIKKEIKSVCSYAFKSTMDILNHIKSTEINDNLLVSLLGIHEKLFLAQINQMQTYRSIMSYLRLPLLQLLSIINFTDKKHHKSLMHRWIRDYELFIEEVESYIFTQHLDTDNYYIEEDLIEYTTGPVSISNKVS